MFLFFQQGTKSSSLLSFLQVVFDGNVLGESDHEEVNLLEQRVDYNFTCCFSPPRNTQVLSRITQKPVICKFSVSELTKKSVFSFSDTYFDFSLCFSQHVLKSYV